MKQSVKAKKPNTAPGAVDPRFARVIEAFAGDRQVSQTRMFGSVGLKVKSKVFAIFYKGKFVAKLPGERVDEIGGRVRGKSALDRPCRGSVPIREGREKMTTLRHQIRIEAPIEAVWKAVSVLTEVQHYNPMVASARFISDQREGVGAMRRCELKPKGWAEERVWEWSPPHMIGLEVAASEWPIAFMKWRTALEKDGDATRMSQDLSYKVKFGPLGALMDLLVMRRMLDKGIGEAFEGLKRYVESSRT